MRNIKTNASGFQTATFETLAGPAAFFRTLDLIRGRANIAMAQALAELNTGSRSARMGLGFATLLAKQA